MSLKILGASLDLVNKKVINLADPSADTDAVNKQYLDSVIRGLDWKPEVLAASTTNVDITAPGTTLDGVTLVNPSRVLLKNQTAPEENGIRIWTGAGATMARALDADAAGELSGSTVTVQQGTVNADRVYRCSTDDPITLETTALTWVQVGSAAAAYTAGNGMTLTGNDFNVVPASGGGISVAADSISVDTAVVVRKFAASVGNGSLTTITTAHGLATADLTVTVYTVSGGEVVYPDITIDATNVVTTWGVAPTTNQYRIVAHG
jgi:hypothetical protein